MDIVICLDLHKVDTSVQILDPNTGEVCARGTYCHYAGLKTTKNGRQVPHHTVKIDGKPRDFPEDLIV